MRILVAGGAGFIGSHIVDALLARGHQPVVVDDLSTGTTDNLPADVELLQIDIASPSLGAAFHGRSYDAVIHCAAIVSVVKSMSDPCLDRRINVGGTAALLSLSQRYRVPKFVFFSSGGAIYGETAVPAEEDALPNPLSYYGVHKYCAEKYVQFSGLPYVSLRLANVYGPRQRAGLEGGVVAIFTERLRAGRPLLVFGDGEQERDFIYVKDVVEAAIAAATTNVTGLWNIGTGQATTVNQLWQMMEKLTGRKAEVQYQPPREGEILRSCLSVRRAVEAGWWRPHHSLEDGLRETLAAE